MEFFRIYLFYFSIKCSILYANYFILEKNILWKLEYSWIYKPHIFNWSIKGCCYSINFYGSTFRKNRYISMISIGYLLINILFIKLSYIILHIPKYSWYRGRILYSCIWSRFWYLSIMDLFSKIKLKR